MSDVTTPQQLRDKVKNIITVSQEIAPFMKDLHFNLNDLPYNRQGVLSIAQYKKLRVELLLNLLMIIFLAPLALFWIVICLGAVWFAGFQFQLDILSFQAVLLLFTAIPFWFLFMIFRDFVALFLDAKRSAVNIITASFKTEYGYKQPSLLHMGEKSLIIPVYLINKLKDHQDRMITAYYLPSSRRVVALELTNAPREDVIEKKDQ